MPRKTTELRQSKGLIELGSEDENETSTVISTPIEDYAERNVLGTETETAPKKKRTQTALQREKTLINLAKGREALNKVRDEKRQLKAQLLEEKINKKAEALEMRKKKEEDNIDDLLDRIAKIKEAQAQKVSAKKSTSKIIVDNEETEPEENIIVVKKNRPRKPRKTVVYLDTETEADTEVEEPKKRSYRKSKKNSSIEEESSEPISPPQSIPIPPVQRAIFF